MHATLRFRGRRPRRDAQCGLEAVRAEMDVPLKRSTMVDVSTFCVIDPTALQASGPPKMRQEEFVRVDGAACPFCGSPEISGGGLSKRSGGLIQAVWGCEACDSEWLACYSLSGFVPGHP
jgi:hypothetical protein